MFFVRSDFRNEALGLSFDKSLEIEYLVAQQLRRRDVRSIIQRFKPKCRLSTDQLVDEICQRLEYVGIARSPWIVVAYLFVVENVRDFSPVNLASVIENLIDVLLEKHGAIIVLRGEFDYNNKVDFLSAIAEHMVRANEFSLPYERLYEVSAQYFARLGLRQNIPEIVRYFTTAKILSLTGNSISFNYPSFFAYFVAKRMGSSEEFFEFMTTEQSSSRFVLELDFYTSIHRSSNEVAQRVLEYYTSSEKRFLDEVYHIVRADLLHNLRVPKEKDTQKLLSDVFSQLEAGLPPPEQRDDYFDGEYPEGVSPRPFMRKVSRPEVKDTFLRWLTFLRLLSRMTKNLELIDHPEKLRMLGICFRGWAKLLLFGLYILEELYVEGEIKIGELKITLKRPTSMKEPDFIREILFLAPLFTADFIRHELGTEKLDLQLKEIPFDPKEIPEEFLRGVLHGDLRIPDKLAQLKLTSQRIKTAPFLLEAFAIRLREMFFRLEDDDKGSVIAFQRFAAEVRAMLAGELSSAFVDREMHRLGTLKHAQMLRPGASDEE